MISATEPLHVVTQEDQPYGSTRRCCEHCGRMCWRGQAGSALRWTDDRAAWSDARDNCSKPPRPAYLTVVK